MMSIGMSSPMTFELVNAVLANHRKGNLHHFSCNMVNPDLDRLCSSMGNLSFQTAAGLESRMTPVSGVRPLRVANWNKLRTPTRLQG